MDDGAVKLPEDAGAVAPPDASAQAAEAVPAYMPRRARLKRERGAKRHRLQGWLTGCGIALLILLPLLGITWWLVGHKLGQMVSGLVRTKASAALNGRLDFASLDIDLAGRAVLTGAAVYLQGENTPVVTCPRAVVTLDIINFIGPNRGRKAVVVDLYSPQALITREPGGAFNLAGLIKPTDPKDQQYGASVHLHDAVIDFTDACLLQQDYPRIPAQQGLAAQLLSELGYSPAGPDEALLHSERVQVNGSVVANPEREELTLDLRAKRDTLGGALTAKGTAKTDGAVFEIAIGLENIELASLADYARALFPHLALGQSQPPIQPGTAAAAPPSAIGPQIAGPSIAGLVRDARLELRKQPGQAVGLNARMRLADLQYASRYLPTLSFPSINANYDASRAGAEFKLDTLGCRITGNPSVDLKTNAINGNVALAKTQVAEVLAALRQGRLGLSAQARSALKQDLPVQGGVSAKATLGGTTAQPEITVQLGSDRLSYGKLKLGQLGGTLKLAQGVLSANEVQFSGGATPVKLAGSVNTATQSGRFSLSAGPVSVPEALDLAARLGQGVQGKALDVQGQFTLSADATLTSGKLSTALKLQSERLVVAGQALAGVSVSGSIAAPDIRITEAVATYMADKPVHAAGFISTGPLRVSLRAGGSISQAPGGKPAITLTGKAGTLNLAPEQANASFKLAGPLSDPEIKLQLKTTQQAHPLAISASGHYREGWAPVSATLKWHAMQAEFKGRVDFAKQLLDGKLNAAAIDLARFANGQPLSGVLSAKAQLGGTFKKPTASGRIELPKLTYALPKRSYQVTGLTAGFKLIGTDTVSIADGKFSFEGNPFTAQGVLGKSSKELSLSCQRFNLLSVLALIETTGAGGTGRQLQVQSAGPLLIKISGDPTHPQAAISYSSGAGSVEGHAFDSARLVASASLDSAQVSSFEIASAQGSISATGSVNFQRPGQPVAQPKKSAGAGLLGLIGVKAAAQAPPAQQSFGLAGFSAQASVNSFDVAVLTPLAGGTALSWLSGKLSGTVKVSGTGKQYAADGALTLTGGRFQGLAVSEASANLQTTGQGIRISNGRVIAEGTVLTASGTLGARPGDANLKAQAESLELALVNPFLAHSKYKLKGPVRLDLQLSPGKGQVPVVDIDVRSTGKPVFVGDTVIDTLSAQAVWRDDALTLQQCSLSLQGSVFTASGTIGKQLNQAKLKAQSASVDLALFAPFMPQAAPKLKGKVALDLTLSPGKGQYPSMDATLKDSGGGLSVGGVEFSSAQASFGLAGSQLEIRQCQLAVNGSTLSAGGKLALSDAKGGNNKNLPLDFWVKSKDFSIASITPLLPAAMRESMPNGKVTCDLQLGGNQKGPLLSGNAQFSLTHMPSALPIAITSLTGDVGFAQNDFDIRRIDIASSDQAGLGQAKISGSGRLSLNPPGLLSGGIDIALAPEGKYTLVKYYDPQSSSKKALFEGTLGGVLHVTGTAKARPVVGGMLVINSPAEVSTMRLEPPDKTRPQTPSPVLLRDLKVKINPGTEIRYAPVDLQATLDGELTVNGTPGNLDPRSPDALRLAGELNVPKGSMFVLGRTIRIDGETNRLQFSGDPGDMLPYFSGRGAIILPRVLTGNEILAGNPQGGGAQQVSAGQDLKVYFNFDHIKLDPASGALDNIRLSSEPPLSTEAIHNFLLGNVESVLTGQTDLSQFAEGEVLGYGTGFISRIIENKFNLESFRLGGSGSSENPYYVDMEKKISPDVSLTYFRNFFGQTGQQEEFGVKYNVFSSQFKSRYQNLDLRLNFTQGGTAGNEREFMFMWTTKF
jgi:autotransporter translocation and assembly factor TamB